MRSINITRETEDFQNGSWYATYLVKHSCPDVSNSFRELLKVADGATEGHFKALLRTVKYVMDTENLGLLSQPKLNQDGFYLEGISDCKYSVDPDNKISVYGSVLYFCGAPFEWKSKAGKSVTLSSTEAEKYDTSEIEKEVIFAKNLLEEIGIQLQFPINVLCDNLGAIYWANNHCDSHRTKRIDTSQHFVREWVEDNTLKIVSTPTLNNTADIFTNNPTEEIFNTHSLKLVKSIPKQSGMCNFMSFPKEAMTHEPKKNAWIKVIKRKKKERINSNYMAKMKAPKQQVKNYPKAKKHNCEFHPRIQMKKGITHDLSQQMIYGPKLCQPLLHIHKKPKSIKMFSNNTLLKCKDSIISNVLTSVRHSYIPSMMDQ
jgi:hypothetical protein